MSAECHHFDMPLRVLSGAEAADRPGGGNLSGTWPWRVCDVLPNGYEAYLRLFNPFGPAQSDELVAIPPADRHRWADLATEAGVPFGPTLTLRQLAPVLALVRVGRRYRVAVGEVERGTALDLMTALGPATGLASVYFWYGLSAEMCGVPDLAFRGTVDSLPEVWSEAERSVQPGLRIRGPELIWSESRRWVVMIHYDHSSAYIACDEASAKMLDSHGGLETVRVTPSTRIDDRADEETSRPG